jgi:hypothetical protein
MIFFTCCVCAYESGLKDMQDIVIIMESILKSGLPASYDKYASEAVDNDDRYGKYYAETIVKSFDKSGFLLGGKHVCNRCCKTLQSKESPAVSNSFNVPENALLNGYWTGKMAFIANNKICLKN